MILHRMLKSLPVALIICSIVASSHAATLKSSTPNILLIMTDDQGVWDTGISGNPHIETPAMDKIAKQGLQFSRFYASAVCAPTRAGLMTGRYFLRTGLYNTRFGGDSLGLNEITVAQLLKKKGYRTGIFGKWHLGKYSGYQPQQRGFDEFLGHYHGHIERYEFPDQLVHNGKPIQARGYVSDLFTDAAMEFISNESKKKKPFFCYLAYNAPHSPFVLDTSHFGQPEGDKILEKYLKKGLPIRTARIYSLVERIDQNLNRLIDFLDESKLSKETIVIFMSDNGGVSKGYKAGIRGNKAQMYEGGVRVPFFVRWPGKIPAGITIDVQASHVDLLPTFCELAGATIPSDRTIDGKSLVPIFEKGSAKSHQKYVYHTWDRYTPNPWYRWGISSQRYKLLLNQGTKNQTKHPEPAGQLYDLKNDPGESKNIAKKHPEIVKELREEFIRWFNDVTKGQNYVPIPVPVGHDDEDPVELQTSWVTLHGDTIKYEFQGYDWDTIEGWSKPGEYATWNLDVVKPGKYEVILSYGCSAANLGGTLEISSDNSTIHFQPKATPTPNVYTKATAGVIELKKGKRLLKVKVSKIGQGELMRLNRIWLKQK